MPNSPLIVVGASAGGLDALAAVLEGVSPDIGAAILAVIHIGAFDVQLPKFFGNRSPLPVHYAEEGERIERGVMYLAPPDRHLLVDDGRLLLARGPRENHTRPAVDPLFRTAAEYYGPLVIGVVLSGYLSDGTAGLWEIKRRGGVAIVQAPDEAAAQSMPKSAVQHVDVDYCLRVKDIGPLLNTLAAAAVKKAPVPAVPTGGREMTHTSEKPIAFTCPECGGAVRKSTMGSYSQFRCHIGHTFGIPELGEGQFDLLEESLETALRVLNERREFCKEAAADARRAKENTLAKAWDDAAEEAETRFNELTKFVETDWKRPEGESPSNGRSIRRAGSFPGAGVME